MTDVYIAPFFRRSGGHAVLHWLGAGYSNYTLVSEIPVTYRPLKRFSNVEWNVDAVFFAVEDKFIAPRSKELTSLLDTYPIKNPTRVFHVSIVRDAYNACASRMRISDNWLWRRRSRGLPDAPDSYYPVHGYNSRLPALWRSIVEQSMEELSSHALMVNFNKWARSDEYRYNLCKCFGLKHLKCEKGKERVTREGGGSSFTGTTKMPEHWELKNRWLGYAKDPRLLEVVLNKEIREINKQVFGWSLRRNRDGDIESEEWPWAAS